jgi:hypothetical protein
MTENQKTSKIICLIAAFIFLMQCQSVAQLPAFPGAEGTGRYTTGGRGTPTSPTTVYEVTRLADDNNPGSLRHALSQNVPYRTIVFLVSGTIHLNSKLNIRANTTIAGQTAPGDGICIADHPVVISGDNVIIRYVRFRMGDKNQNGGMVDGSGGDDVLGNLGNKNIIIDHCSISWSSDECLTIYRGDSVTVQWNIVSEPLNYSYHFETGGTDFQEHGYGGIWGSRNGSFHHNLIAHAKGRMPRFAGSSTYTPGTAGQENADFRNNVIYNWISYSTNGGEGGNYNVVNNYYKYGPSTSTGNTSGVPIRYQIMNPSKSTALPYPKIFLEGNYVDGSPAITSSNWRGMAMAGGSLADTVLSKVNTPFNLLPVPMQAATDAYELVLQHAGTKLPARDTLDQRIVSDVRNRTGRIIDVQGGFPHGTPYAQTVNAWPALQSGSAPADDDHDGMPNAWEAAMGLNPTNASDRNVIASNGYTTLENYLNSLAADAISVTGSFSHFNQGLGNPSGFQTYTVSGKNLTGNITIIPSAPFEVSLNGTTWYNAANPLQINHTAGTIAPVTISVRLNGTSAGSFNGSIRHRAHAGGYVDIAIAGTASAATGIADINISNLLSLYPNPATTRITLRHPVVSGQASIHIFGSDGKRMVNLKVRERSDRTEISLDTLAKGRYTVEFISKRSKGVLSFLKLEQ